MEWRQLDNMRQSLLDEGFIGETFVQSERLHSEADPNFIEEMISVFYTRNSVRCLQPIEQALERTPTDFSTLKTLMVRFLGYSSCLGARRIGKKCLEFMEYCAMGNGNLEGCKMAFRQLQEELATIKEKLEAYFLLGRQIRAADTADGSNRAVDHHNGVSL